MSGREQVPSSAPGCAQVEELSASACWDLLRRRRVGRLAVLVGGAPDVFPVTYAVDHGSVVFRTADGTKLRALSVHPRVAFEVDDEGTAGDDADPAWSVVLRGRAWEVRGLHPLLDVEQLALSAWQAGPKPRFVRVEPEVVTGRRFRVAARPAGANARRSPDE